MIDSALDKLATAAQGSTGEIEKYFNDQIADRNRGIKEQQERIADLAEIDAAVLSDELPLDAYLDHGFNAYLSQSE